MSQNDQVSNINIEYRIDHKMQNASNTIDISTTTKKTSPR